jgi:hypothetical protein
MDVMKNIKRMFSKGDGHGRVLAASIGRLEHLCFALKTELATVFAKVLWTSKNFPTHHTSSNTRLPVN